jgi:hypothetical protein
VLARNPQSGNFRDTPLETTGAAVKTDRGTLFLDGGSFRSSDAGGDVMQSVQASGELSLEVALVPRATQDDASGIVLSLGQPEGPHIELRQDGGWLLLRVTAVSDGEPVELRLGELLPGKRSHIIVAGRPGNLVGYVNGSQTAGKSDALLTADKWTAGPLSIGASVEGDEPWRGEVERLAIFAHFMDADEARRERDRHELVHP